MTGGIDNLRHIVVLMMENRSFDHMLGALKKQYPKINGLTVALIYVLCVIVQAAQEVIKSLLEHESRNYGRNDQ